MALFRRDVLQNAERLVSKGKVEGAIKEYRKYLDKSPDDTSTLNRVGDLYARVHKNDEAVRYYKQTAERYAADGFYVKAIAVYKKIHRIEPGRLAATAGCACCAIWRISYGAAVFRGSRASTKPAVAVWQVRWWRLR